MQFYRHPSKGCREHSHFFWFYWPSKEIHCLDLLSLSGSCPTSKLVFSRSTHSTIVLSVFVSSTIWWHVTIVEEGCLRLSTAVFATLADATSSAPVLQLVAHHEMSQGSLNPAASPTLMSSCAPYASDIQASPPAGQYSHLPVDKCRNCPMTSRVFSADTLK